MLLEVRGQGTLVPERTHLITAQTSGRVEQLISQTGEDVELGQVLVEMSNPDLQIQAMQADRQVRQAQTDLMALRTEFESAILSQEGLVASTRTQYVSARQDAAAADSLLKDRLVSKFEANNKTVHAEELTTRLRIETQRLALMKQAILAQGTAQTAQVEQLKSIARSQQERLLSLKVRAPEPGVLQDLELQLGQWVPEGATLGKIVQPERLKAVLRIPESLAKDIVVGQRAIVDTHNGLVPGHVTRKNPAAQAGTVTIDVALDGPLPAGAVPDVSIDGTIEINRLLNVLYTGRPNSGSGTERVGLFKLVDNDNAAIRVQVALGRRSMNTVEVVKGLQERDKVILSDMSAYDNVDRVRIK